MAKNETNLVSWEGLKAKFFYCKLSDLKPYSNNPRINEKATPSVKNSIKDFGFLVPIVVDNEQNLEIVAGHTRRLASMQLCEEEGLDASKVEIPCLSAEHLNPSQIKMFRLADNKVSEASVWDFDKMIDELKSLADEFTLSDYGFADSKMPEWADDIQDLDEENYDKPEKEMIRCPHCGHVDTKTHFIKVSDSEKDEKN